jgi:signal transduction histidine kinase
MQARTRSEAARQAWLGAGAPIIALVLIVTMLAWVLVASFARQQDEGFVRDSTRLMQSALEDRAEAIADQARDYGSWDDAYVAVTRGWDAEWLEGNYFTTIADALIVFRPQADAPRHAWVSELHADGGAALAQAALRTSQAALSAQYSAQPEVSGHFVWNGMLVLVSAAPIRMLEGGAPELDYVAIIEVFEPDEIAAIAAARDLDDAVFVPGPASAPPRTVALPIADQNEIAGVVAWRDERPGGAAFVGQLWPIVLGLLLVGALTVAVAHKLVAVNVDNAARAETALESSRMRAEFISTMSHELRTPLSAIIGYAELIKEEAASGEPGPVIEGDADNVLEAARHLRQLVDDILDHSSFDAGRMKLTIERLPVAGLLAEIAEHMAPEATENENAFSVDCSADGFHVLGDDTRVRQCLVNLISNAAKFTSRGEIRVHARLDATDPAQPRIAFDVTDTGIGIDPEALARLFKPFVHASSSVHMKYGGAGLGLSISQKLARAMGGEITAISELGRGSTFTLTLPGAASNEDVTLDRAA